MESIHTPDEAFQASNQNLEARESKVQMNSIRSSDLVNLNEDIRSMPPCIERSLISIIYYSLLKDSDKSLLSDLKIASPDDIAKQIEKELTYLNEHSHREEIVLTKWLDTMRYQLEKGKWEEVNKEARTLLKSLRPLDIQELVRLIDRGVKAADLIKGQQVFFLCGGTGSGKSTFIQFLVGSKMVKVKFEIEPGKFLDHIQPAEPPKNVELASIVSSPFAQSETRYISPVQFDPTDIGAFGAKVILCDAPGFGDTAGPEVDIANSIAIQTALKGCKGVKLVILSSYQSIGDRGEGIKKLAHTLVGMVSGIEDILCTFSYVFTKYPADFDVNSSLINIRKSLDKTGESSDKAFVALIEDMIEKTERGAIMINPLEDSPKTVFKELSRTASINNPSETFQCSNLENSKEIFKNQLDKYQLNIMAATKNGNYNLVEFRLDQIKFLLNIFNQEFIYQVYNDCTSHVSQHIKKKIEDTISYFNHNLERQNTLSIQDIEQYQLTMTQIKSTERIIERHLDTSTAQVSTLTQNVLTKVDEIVKGLYNSEMSSYSTEIQLDNLRLLAESFEEVGPKYNQICQFFMGKINESLRLAQNSIKTNDFVKSAEEMTKIRQSLLRVQRHLGLSGDREMATHLNTTLLEHLKSKVDDVIPLLAKDCLSENDIRLLAKCVSIFESVIETVRLHDYIVVQGVKIMKEEFFSQVVGYFKGISDRINRLYEQERENSFKDIEKYVKEMNSLKKIPGFEPLTSSIYYNVIGSLVEKIQSLKSNAESQLRNFQQDPENVNYNKFFRCLSGIKSSQWIEQERPGLCSDVMRDVSQDLIEYAQKLQLQLEEVDLDLENFENIEHAYKIVKQIEPLEQLELTIPTISSYKEKVHQGFMQATEAVFNIINKMITSEDLKILFNKETPQKADDTSSDKKNAEASQKSYTLYRMDRDKAENALNYLEACKKTLDLRGKAINLLSSLKEFIQQYFKFIQDDMHSCFERITSMNLEEGKQNEANNVIDCAQNFVSRIKEVFELEKKCPRIFRYINGQEIVLYWQDMLSNNLLTMIDDMNTIVNQNKLRAKLGLVRILSQLDKALPEGKKYFDIYREYQVKCHQECGNIHKKIMKLIQAYDYANVARELALQGNEISTPNVMNEIKNMLTLSVTELYNESKTKAILLSKEIEVETIETIVENFKRMKNAVESLKVYLEGVNTNTEEIEKIVSEKIILFMEMIEGLISNNDFEGAERRRDHIIRIRHLLGNHCATTEVSEKMEALETKLSNVFNEIEKRYAGMSLNNYLYNPPKAILDKLAASRDLRAAESLNKIKESVIQKFTSSLENAREIGAMDLKNGCLRQCESVIRSLPDSLKEVLENQLRDTKKDIHKQEKACQDELENALLHEDIQQCGLLIKRYSKVNMPALESKLRTEVLKKIETLKQKVNEAFNNDDLKSAFDKIIRLFEYKEALGREIYEVERTFSEVKIVFSQKFNKSCECLANGMKLFEISEFIGRNFDIFMDCIFFKHENGTKSNDFFTEDFDIKITELTTKLTRDLSENHKRFEDGLTNNMRDVGEALKIAKNWEILLQKANRYRVQGQHFTFLTKLLESTKSYSDMTRELSLQLASFRSEIISCDLANRGLEKQREEIYQRLSSKFKLIKQARELKEQINMDLINIDCAEEDCLQAMKSKIEEATSIVIERLHQTTLTIRDYDQIRFFYDNIALITKYINLNGTQFIEKVDTMIFAKIAELHELGKQDDPTFVNIKYSLIAMKTISDNIPAFKQRINDEIDQLLLNFKKSQGPLALPTLCAILQEETSGVGQTIIDEHKIFKGEANRLWATATQQHDIKYVLDNLTGDRLDKEKLSDLYSQFEAVYKNTVFAKIAEVGHNSAEVQKSLVSKIKMVAGNVKHKPNKVIWDSSVKEKIAPLIANIFAFWTLKNTQHYNEMIGNSERNAYLLKPHPAQVVSIFRMLGMGYDLKGFTLFGYTFGSKEALINNLVQIGTGEGKSVTLAVTACVLALLGMDVSCACYSEYLSSRDYQEFQPLFDALGLVKHIHYGTFNKVCERIINENGDVRSQVINLINNVSEAISVPNSIAKKTSRPKILLIDEVDVFFNKEFYGNIYTPLAELKDPTINQLVNLIWSRGKNKSVNSLKTAPEYQACCARFPGWEFIIEEAVKDMTSDLSCFESHDYRVMNDKIAYKEQDGISYTTVYGYKTLFAYYHENAKGKITDKSLEENIKILVHCGSFSYAEIPHRFAYIMGVTGTLQTLSEAERDVMRTQYKIDMNTYMPSVFGINRRGFKPENDLFIESKDTYYMQIRDQIDKRLEGVTPGTKRAVMVFFESKKKLEDFYNCAALETIKDKVQYMTEEVLLKEKESIIKRATVSDQITLMTKVFGRGTDFICRNKMVLSNGGAHVIQTFLSEEKSEEVQIQGRTARQGQDGTFSMILFDEELEAFLSREELKSLPGGAKRYEILDQKRNAYFRKQYADQSLSINEAKDKHDAAEKLLSSFTTGDFEYIKNFLKQENKGVSMGSSSRTICLMDATGSMGHLLQNAKNTVGTMFERASEILKDNGRETNFELQFVVYRDYDCKVEGILSASPWEKKPNNLRRFMDTMLPQGGGDYEEAIEIGLWHVNQENKEERVTQVILIGDAPAKSAEQIRDYRNNHGGEAYWAGSRFGGTTHYKTELRELKNQGIPVHAFYVANGAKTNFKEIADETNGTCEELDVNSSTGAQRLTDVVTEKILKDVGQENGDLFVQQYRKKFVKGFT